MLHDVRAELSKQARRPASWLLLGLASALTLTFAYLVPYAALSGATQGPAGNGRGLADLLPAQLVENTIGGTPVFVGAFALIFGVLVVGSEYGWETWKTLLSLRPHRLGMYAAKLVVVAVGSAVLVLTLFATGGAAGTVVAVLEEGTTNLPALAEVLTGFGAAWLICTMWGLLGAMLAVVLRGVALPVGLGLVWLLAVQNLLAAIAAPMLDWVAELQKYLPGPNAGSLVASLGAPPSPGVEELVSTQHATTVLAIYLVGFALVGGWFLQRRDIR